MEQIQICTIKEVQKIVNVSKTQASRMIVILRDVLNKPKPKIVSVREFREYYGI